MFPSHSVKTICLALALAIFGMTQTALAQSPPSAEQLHDELRALRDRLVTATNEFDLDGVAAELAPDVILTDMTNEVLRGPEEVEAHLNRMFRGDSRLIESMSVEVFVDELARLHGDNQVATSTGDVTAHFVMATDREFDWPIRWTATLVRHEDRWLISTVHFSANVIDNPLVDFAGGLMGFWPVGAGLLGLIAGFVLARIRRKTV